MTDTTYVCLHVFRLHTKAVGRPALLESISFQSSPLTLSPRRGQHNLLMLRDEVRYRSTTWLRNSTAHSLPSTCHGGFCSHLFAGSVLFLFPGLDLSYSFTSHVHVRHPLLASGLSALPNIVHNIQFEWNARNVSKLRGRLRVMLQQVTAVDRVVSKK